MEIVEKVDESEGETRVYHVTADVSRHEFRDLKEFQELVGKRNYWVVELKPGGIFRVTAWPGKSFRVQEK